MNSVQIHLALTHVPVMLSLVGLIMLIVAYFIKNTTLTRISYILLIAAGASAIPVNLSGEETEEAVENLPGISEIVIERHEEVAELAMISIAVAGLLAVTALFALRWQIASRICKNAVLVSAFVSFGLMAQTAHLGGQIRHTEMSSGNVIQNVNEANNENNSYSNHNKQKDND